MRRQQKKRPVKRRTPVPPPGEVMRDRRQRRPGTRSQQIQRELDAVEREIDEALEELGDME